MFAVHEEVEVLKEQIKELTMKNAQLEFENSVLRSAAPPDVLAKLDATPATPAPSAAPNIAGQPSSGALS
jgi:regulator of replication initiation timing